MSNSPQLPWLIPYFSKVKWNLPQCLNDLGHRLYHRYNWSRSFRIFQPLHCNWLWNLITNQLICSNRWPSPACITNLCISTHNLPESFMNHLCTKKSFTWKILAANLLDLMKTVYMLDEKIYEAETISNFVTFSSQ